MVDNLENQQPSSYVVCTLCNIKRADLTKHIVASHGISVATYKERYPDSLVRLPHLTERIAKMASSNAVKANKCRIALIKQGKVNPGGSTRPNRSEKQVIDLNIPNLEYVGDRKFWIGWTDDSFHNPDFVVRPFHLNRKVIEFFGDRWHGEEVTGMSKEEHEQLYINQYKGVDIQCLVIWGSELSYSANEVEQRIRSFITEGSESRHGTSSAEDEGVLQSTAQAVEEVRDNLSNAFVYCAVCNTKLKQITWTHLRTKHNMTMEEYIDCFPDSMLTHPENNKVMISQHKKGVLRKYGVENVSQVKEIRQKQKDTMIQRYGTISLGGRKRL